MDQRVGGGGASWGGTNGRWAKTKRPPPASPDPRRADSVRPGDGPTRTRTHIIWIFTPAETSSTEWRWLSRFTLNKKYRESMKLPHLPRKVFPAILCNDRAYICGRSLGRCACARTCVQTVRTCVSASALANTRVHSKRASVRTGMRTIVCAWTGAQTMYVSVHAYGCKH